MDHPKKPLGNIQEVVSWRSYLTNVKQRHAGDSLAYFGKYVLDKDTVVATVGVGYGDGLNEKLVACHAPVLVGGKRCPLLACCMDQCFVDVTGVEDAKVGDEITFFGYDSDGNFLSSQETANLIGDDRGLRPDLRPDAPRRPRIPLISARRVPHVPVNGYFCIHRCIIFDITV